jgi:peptidoglycan/xylan/chitin deacetylase (PgdA/CDA1 family)
MSFKSAIKKCLSTVCESRILLPLIRRSAMNDVNIIYYHYIGDPVPHYQAFGNGCTISEFAQDLEYLSRIFEFASLSEVLARAPGKGNPKRPTLAVTFDDGFDLSNQGVMEIMEDYNIKATTFVVTSCIDNRRMMWRHMLSAIQSLTPESIWRSQYNELALSSGFDPIKNGEGLLKVSSRWEMNHKDEWAAQLWERCELPPISEYLAERQPYFGWSGLEQWIASGHSVGFHTHTHPYCSRLQQADLESELIEPAITLKQRLNIEELALSYPFGDRLRPEMDQKLFEQRQFKALFGIDGFSRKDVSNEKLERVGVEGGHTGWSIFRGHVAARLQKR